MIWQWRISIFYAGGDPPRIARRIALPGTSARQQLASRRGNTPALAALTRKFIDASPKEIDLYIVNKKADHGPNFDYPTLLMEWIDLPR